MMTDRTAELALPAYITLPDGDDPEGLFVALHRATVGQLQVCVETRATKIANDHAQLFPLRTLLSVRRADGAEDRDIALVPGAIPALSAGVQGDFTDAEYERLNALLDADPRVVKLIIHVTRGVAIEDAAAQMVSRGQQDIAAGAALVALAKHQDT